MGCKLYVHADRPACLQIGKLDESNQHADAALAFNSQADNNEELTRAMNTLKVHVNEGNPKAKSADPKDASPAMLADLTVQRILSKFISSPAAKAAIEAAYKKLDPDPDSPAADIPLLQVAKLGFAAAVCGDSEYGITLANRAMSGKNASAKAWGEFVTTHVRLEAAVPQTGKGSCKIMKSDVSTLCSVLEELEACLQKFSVLVDIVGIHACCRYVPIWACLVMLVRTSSATRILCTISRDRNPVSGSCHRGECDWQYLDACGA